MAVNIFMVSSDRDRVSHGGPAEKDTGEEFPAQRLKAPFVLRCAALCIDYLVLIIFPILWLIAGRFVTDNGMVVIAGWVWAVAIILFLFNFLCLPIVRGRTIGKGMLGLIIVNMDGTPLTFWGAIKRNLFGYLATILTVGIGFVISAFNYSGRSLHDLIGGTIVVRGHRTSV